MTLNNLDISEQLEVWETVEETWWPVKEWLENEITTASSRLTDKEQTQTLDEVRDLQAHISVYRCLANLPERQVKLLREKIDGRRS